MMRIENLATHPEKYCTVREVADYLHVGKGYVWKLVRAGTLATIEPPAGSRLVRISVDSVRRAFRESRS
jgi:excisionase family DNA binding protein